MEINKTIPNCRLFITNHRLCFLQPAGTSRGVYHTRQVWYVWVTSADTPGRYGVGECAPLPELSCDAFPDYESILYNVCREIEKSGRLDVETLRPYPSMLFGLETAFRHYHQQPEPLWCTSFSAGEAGIPINGLIWMGSIDQMRAQIQTKIEAGYRCVKLKIGAIDFDRELELLYSIREHFNRDEITLRVDANGAFSPDEAMDKLRRLAALDIHSIEQPIRAGQWREMAELVAQTPLPIALDEELIGVNTTEEKRRLLKTIRPHYIILKPSLHGGISGCAEWIREAERLQIGWWITSALESNIGLNAIAQWTATLNTTLPQGLGTGMLFADNIDIPLCIRKDRLWFRKEVDTPNHEAINDESLKAPLLSKGGGGPLLAAVGWFGEINNDLYTFLSEWWGESDSMSVQTSGSTGTPKVMKARKTAMKHSARMTCDYFNLKAGDVALLCMPLQYIAGKMMVVRAVERDMRLIVRKPSSNPLKDVDEAVDFAAMTPAQVYSTLQVPQDRERLKQVKVLLIGGGSLSGELLNQLKDFPNAVYATYGMTETLSHIAVRKLSGGEQEACYTPFPGVKLSVTDAGTLCIDAPAVSAEQIETTDMVELLPDGRFRFLGRKDNVINSGGVKIPAEQVEEALSTVLSGRFVITSVPDEQYGEAVTLLTEEELLSVDVIRSVLPKYQRPKYCCQVERIPLTANGKTDRPACKRLALTCVGLI